MPMNSQTQSFVTDLVTFAEAALKVIDAAAALNASFIQNGIDGKITNGDLALVPQFDYLSKANVNLAIAAMQALAAAMGDKSTGQQTAFIKVIA